MTKTICSVEDCSNGGQLRRGWCDMHYQRWRAHGDPMTTLTAPTGEPQRWLDEHLSTAPTECVEWPYSTRHGYGQVIINGTKRQVTHLVLERTGRPRPPAPNHWALHSCDNPTCVNPSHLRWGSREDNVSDMVGRGRSCSPIGESNPRSILTSEDVRAIRDRYAVGDNTMQSLGEEYGVCSSAIDRIVQRLNWKHVA